MLPTSHPHLPPYRLPKHSPTRGEEGGTSEINVYTLVWECFVQRREGQKRARVRGEGRKANLLPLVRYVRYVRVFGTSGVPERRKAIGLRAIRDRSSLEGKERTRETHAAHRSFTVVDDVCYIGIRDEYRMHQLSTTI